MTDNETELKVIFSPESIDSLVEEFGYEEAQKIVDEITKAAQDGTLLTQGRELSDEEIKELGLDLEEDFSAPNPTLH
jgi:uncharacterized protein YjgD (DUF1641 family)